MNERRKHKRIDAEYPVKAQYSVGWKKVNEQSQLKDICSGGVKFISETKIRRGSPIEIEINVPGELVSDLLGIKGLDPKKELCFKTKGVVIRREDQNESNDGKNVAVKFTGPLQISLTEESKK